MHDGKGKEGELATQGLSSAFALDCLLEPRVKGKRSNLSLSSYLGLCGFWILDRFR